MRCRRARTAHGGDDPRVEHGAGGGVAGAAEAGVADRDADDIAVVDGEGAELPFDTGARCAVGSQDPGGPAVAAETEVGEAEPQPLPDRLAVCLLEGPHPYERGAPPLRREPFQDGQLVRRADMAVQPARVERAVGPLRVHPDQPFRGEPDEQQVLGVAEADVHRVVAAQIGAAGGAVPEFDGLRGHPQRHRGGELQQHPGRGEPGPHVRVRHLQVAVPVPAQQSTQPRGARPVRPPVGEPGVQHRDLVLLQVGADLVPGSVTAGDPHRLPERWAGCRPPPRHRSPPIPA